MREIRDTAAEYELKDLYSMDESELFYRMGPRKQYLYPSEDPCRARGTDFARQKSRITIVLCVYADGSYSVFIRCTGNSGESRCFRDHRFDEYKSHYSSQSNAWMDGRNFDEWILWWYNEVHRINWSNILLIMANYGGHERDIHLPGVRIETLPVNSTSKK